MQSETGPSDLSNGGKHALGQAPGLSRHHDNPDNTKGGTRRLAMFYLAHWPDESLAAIMPTLRQYALIPPETA